MDTSNIAPVEITAENLEAELARRGCHGPNYGPGGHPYHIGDNVADAAIAPTHPGNPRFDFETVFEHLDGPPPENTTVDDATKSKRLAMKMAAKAMVAFMDWALEVNLGDPRALKAVGLRAVAMAWVTNPDRFAGASLTTLSKTLRLTDHTSLARATSSFSRTFKLYNAWQRHAANKDEYDPSRN